jgi:hypothetical protein
MLAPEVLLAMAFMPTASVLAVAIPSVDWAPLPIAIAFGPVATDDQPAENA